LVGVAFVTALNSGLANIGLTDAGYAFAKGVIILLALSLQVIARRLVALQARRSRAVATSFPTASPASAP
jgi:ribose/xylose/arabinose/galactoside ABC-type transport system permease subunit